MYDIDYDIEELRAQIEVLEEKLGDIENQLNDERAHRAGNSKLNHFDGAAKVGAIDTHHLACRLPLIGHFGKIYTLNWSPVPENYNHLLSASQDGTMIVWNAMRGLKNQIVRLDCQWVMASSFTADGRTLACGGLDNNVTMYPVSIGRDDAQVSSTLQHHDGYISCIRFLNNAQAITSSGDATCIQWDLETEAPLTVFAEHEGDVMSVSPASESTFFSGATDSRAKLWDVRVNRCIRTFKGHEADVNAVVAFPDGHAVITGSDDNSCKLYDVRSYSELNSYTFDNDQMTSVTSVDISKTGRLLFAGYDNCTVHVWDVIHAKTVGGHLVDNALGMKANPEGVAHSNRVACLAINGDGMALATGSWDETMKIWA